jgi:hypothetical protein
MYSGAQDNARAGYGHRTRMSYTSALSEEKENTVDAVTAQYGRGKLSPELGRNGRNSAASGSGGRNSPAPAYQSRIRDTSTEGAKPEGNGQGVESWKRAAEVTSALKAKIEQMKVRLFPPSHRLHVNHSTGSTRHLETLNPLLLNLCNVNLRRAYLARWCLHSGCGSVWSTSLLRFSLRSSCNVKERRGEQAFDDVNDGAWNGMGRMHDWRCACGLGCFCALVWVWSCRYEREI